MKVYLALFVSHSGGIVGIVAEIAQIYPKSPIGISACESTVAKRLRVSSSTLLIINDAVIAPYAVPHKVSFFIVQT